MTADEVSTAATEDNPRDGLGFESFSIEFLKFLAWVIGACLFFVGYAYSFGFYGAFGIQMSDIESDYTSVVTTTLMAFQDLRVLLSLVMAILLLTGLYRITWRQRQFRVPIVALAALSLIFLAGKFGIYIGRDHASQIISGRSGKIAYCMLKPDSVTEKLLGSRHLKSTTQHAYRKIRETDKVIYLMDTSWKGAPPDGTGRTRPRGHSLALEKADVAFCRVFGA